MNETPRDGIIIYTTDDGKSNISLFARDGSVWLNQSQMAELFDTSKQNISLHVNNILEEKELRKNSVVKDYLTTAADGKNYRVAFYSLEMIIAVGFRVRSPLLAFNGFEVLNNAGHVANREMEQVVAERYMTFDAKRKTEDAAAADREDMEELEAMEARVIRKRGKGSAKK